MPSYLARFRENRRLLNIASFGRHARPSTVPRSVAPVLAEPDPAPDDTTEVEGPNLPGVPSSNPLGAGPKLSDANARFYLRQVGAPYRDGQDRRWFNPAYMFGGAGDGTIGNEQGFYAVTAEHPRAPGYDPLGITGAEFDRRMRAFSLPVYLTLKVLDQQNRRLTGYDFGSTSLRLVTSQVRIEGARGLQTVFNFYLSARWVDLYLYLQGSANWGWKARVVQPTTRTAIDAMTGNSGGIDVPAIAFPPNFTQPDNSGARIVTLAHESFPWCTLPRDGLAGDRSASLDRADYATQSHFENTLTGLGPIVRYHWESGYTPPSAATAAVAGSGPTTWEADPTDIWGNERVTNDEGFWEYHGDRRLIFTTTAPA